MANEQKIAELVEKYKLHQGFTDDSFDDVIRFNVESAIQYILNAGVSEAQIAAGKADFAIIRGAVDMWESDRFSRMFFMLVTQVRADVSTKPTGKRRRPPSKGGNDG